jgi:hypothetical protein
MKSTAGLMAFALVGLSGCGTHVPPAAPGLSSEPRASWSIRAGERYGAEPEVCRSDRDQSCVIAASSEGQPTSVVVTVFLYPAGENETAYRGAFIAGFIGRDEHGFETKVDYSIKPGQRPYYIASIGQATSVEGSYELRIALLADVPGHADPYQFEQAIPVRVERAETATGAE